MATAVVAMPPATTILVGAVQIKPAEPQGIRLLGRKEALMVNIFCRHDWSLPYTSPEFTYPAPTREVDHSAHQSCMRCGVRRLFDTMTYHGGPLFREIIRQRFVGPRNRDGDSARRWRL